ncbi:MAG TPA: SRPBCC domain-containing protein [Polyangiaceae bacterium]|nr:SRPBCC domain-containing protein [Polyangiaceae bacterium]
MKRIEVNVSRVIPASPAEVFEVWLDTKSPGGPWFGCERVILHAVVDGLFYHSGRHQGRVWAHYGRFVRLERPRLIEHTWMSEATRGIESTVTVTLEPKGQDTLLTLCHSDLPDDDLGRQHEEGWKFITGAIADRFGSRRRAG